MEEKLKIAFWSNCHKRGGVTSNLACMATMAALSGTGKSILLENHFNPENLGSILVAEEKKSFLQERAAYYDKYGGKTIIIARFIPIVRTFAPFVAGVGAMEYKKFVKFDICGGILWVGLVTLVGYFFGNIPAVENNFSIVVFVIIGFSLIAPAYGFIKSRLSTAK